MEIKEEQLVADAQQGNLEAFNRLVLAYQTQVFNVAYRILCDEGAADDAAQNAFISAYKKIHTFRGGSFRSWLLTIVTHQCYDDLRSHKRRPTVPLEVDNGDGEDFKDSDEWLTDGKPGPEEHSMSREMEQAIQHCLENLPQEFRVVAILVDVEGIDYAEAAEIAKTPLGTVKSRLARARQRLRDCLRGFEELLPEQFRHIPEGSA